MEPIINSVDACIKWPFKWTLVGSSGSGKTNFAINMIKESGRLFDQKADRVIIIYKVFQEIYNTCKDYFPTSFYTEDECDLEELTLGNKDKLLIICDDLYFSKKLTEISEHFLVKGRHRNTSWIVLTQSIFNQPALKNISRNSTHMTLFKNVRLSEPHILFSQLRPKSSKVLQNIYADATEKPYGYLDIDLSQTCPDKLRYKTNIFDSIVKVYEIMNDSTFKTMYLVDKNFIDDQKRFKLSIQNKDICTNGLNVTVKPIKRRKSKDHQDNDGDNGDTDKRTNDNKKEQQYIGEDSDDDDDDDDGNGSEYNRSYNVKHENNDLPELKPTVPITPYIEHHPYSTWQSPQLDTNQSMHAEKLNLKRKQTQLLDVDDDTPKKARIQKQRSLWKGKPKRKIKGYRLNKHQKRFKKRQLNEMVSKTAQTKRAKPSSGDFQFERRGMDSDDQNSDESSHDIAFGENDTENNETEIEDTTPSIQGESEEHMSQRNVHAKRQRLEDEKGDEWISGLKTRLNDRRVQFKRKNDVIGYRVLPVDESKSLIKPADFKFLDPITSSELLGKWKPLKDLKRKQHGTKRFKPLRSFSVWKKMNN